MNGVATYDPPALEGGGKLESAIERERQAFRRLLPELLNTHRGQYVAVHGGGVVESGPIELEVLRKVYDRFGSVPMWLAQVTAEPPVARVPTYRVAAGL